MPDPDGEVLQGDLSRPLAMARFHVGEAVKALHVLGRSATGDEVPAAVDRYATAFALFAALFSGEEVSAARAIVYTDLGIAEGTELTVTQTIDVMLDIVGQLSPAAPPSRPGIAH
jgi:hypothetical protein